MCAAGARPAVLPRHAGATGTGPLWPSESNATIDGNLTRDHTEKPGVVISAFSGIFTGFLAFRAEREMLVTRRFSIPLPLMRATFSSGLEGAYRRGRKVD